MVTITKTGEQYRITIPKEIIKLTKWKEGTEIIFIPLVDNPKTKLSKNDPLMVKEVVDE